MSITWTQIHLSLGHLPMCGHLWDSLCCIFLCLKNRLAPSTIHLSEIKLVCSSPTKLAARSLSCWSSSIHLLSLIVAESCLPPVVMFPSERGEGGDLNMDWKISFPLAQGPRDPGAQNDAPRVHTHRMSQKPFLKLEPCSLLFPYKVKADKFIYINYILMSSVHFLLPHLEFI